jgi:glycosyltransferase involved in cell wall biosynthesis
VGTISKSKGAFFLLDSFIKMNKQIKLTVVGNLQDKKDEEKIRLKYRRSNIDFPGFRDPEEMFQDIDVLIIPSLWNEPLSRVILEANSNGIPVIASKRGGIKEIVDEGNTGFLFDPAKKGDLEEKIEKFWDNPSLAFSMSDQCLKKAREFSPRKITEKYLKVYNDLI